MNLFRFLGNLCHVGATAYLIQRIRETQSVRGLSLKTAQLALLAFITRYMDILHPGGTLQFLLRVVSVATAGYTLLLFRVFGSSRYGGYDVSLDTANSLHLLVPCALLALLFHYKWQVTHVAAEFATFLEAVSVWPQLTLMHNLPAAAIPAPMGTGPARESPRVLFDAATTASPSTSLADDAPATSPGDKSVPDPAPAPAAAGKTYTPQELEPTLIDRNYLFLLAAYRIFYIPGWLYRYFAITALDPIEMAASGVGIALLIDLFHCTFWPSSSSTPPTCCPRRPCRAPPH